MVQFFQKYILPLSVFLCGGIVMVYELLGSRIVAPYIGTSSFVWTSLIGIVLGGLSLGYILGGKLSDLYPNRLVFAAVILTSGYSLLGIYSIKETVLVFLSNIFIDQRISSVAVGLSLFFVPSVLLGIVSPLAAKLRLASLSTAGSTVGSLYALSTLGSITGTFLAGFWLIPSIGTNKLLFLLAASLILLGIAVMFFSEEGKKTIKIAVASISVVILLLISLIRPILPSHVIFDGDTQYSRVWVMDGVHASNKQPIRFLRLNKQNSSAMYHHSGALVYPYTEYYHLARYFAPNFSKTLMLGGAGYSFPKSFLETYPVATMDVVEIDPGVTKIAQDFFNLQESDRLNIYHEDARTYLNRNTQKYDVIFGDAFSSQYGIPYQLTTIEAVKKKYDSLSDTGAVILNTISSLEGEKGEFFRAEYATYKKIFPHVLVFPVTTQDTLAVQNIILVALKSSNKLLELQNVAQANIGTKVSIDAEISKLLSSQWNNPVMDDMFVLTDEYAPVDTMLEKTLKK